MLPPGVSPINILVQNEHEICMYFIKPNQSSNTGIKGNNEIGQTQHNSV